MSKMGAPPKGEVLLTNISPDLKDDCTNQKEKNKNKARTREGGDATEEGSQQVADQQAGPEAQGGKASQTHKNRSKPLHDKIFCFVSSRHASISRPVPAASAMSHQEQPIVIRADSCQPARPHSVNRRSWQRQCSHEQQRNKIKWKRLRFVPSRVSGKPNT